MKRKNLSILSLNHDLLSPEKQAIARWLCEDWKFGEVTVPKWLQNKYRQLFHFPLHEPETPEKMARELILELLSKYKQEILARQRSAALTTSSMPTPSARP